MSNNHESQKEALLYSGIAVGVVLGAAAATWLWIQRARMLRELNTTPEERAETIIANVEKKLASIEEAMDKIQNGN